MPTVSWHPAQLISNWFVAGAGCGNSNCWQLCWRDVTVYNWPSNRTPLEDGLVMLPPTVTGDNHSYSRLDIWIRHVIQTRPFYLRLVVELLSYWCQQISWCICGGIVDPKIEEPFLLDPTQRLPKCTENQPSWPLHWWKFRSWIHAARRPIGEC